MHKIPYHLKPRMFKRGKWWICRAVLDEQGLRGVVLIGQGRKIETAYKDYARKYNWFKRGCPGAPFWMRSTLSPARAPVSKLEREP